MCWDEAFCESEIARKGPCIIRSSCQASARARSQVRRSTAPNSDAVRSTGKRGPRFRAPFCGMSVFEGGVLPETGWFSSTREEGAGRRGRCQEAVVPLTSHYTCRSLAAAKREGRKAPSRSLPLMKTSQFLAGLPYFSATKVRGGCLLGRTRVSSRATRTPGRSCPSDPVPCSTANPSSPCSALPPQTRLACSWQLLDEHGESFRIASRSNG